MWFDIESIDVFATGFLILTQLYKLAKKESECGLLYEEDLLDFFEKEKTPFAYAILWDCRLIEKAS